MDFLWAIIGKIVFFTGTIGGKNSFPKPLTKEEEEKYLALARKGDKEAKDVLIKHNMRLVAHIVKKYTGAAETDDLISVGSIGLIKAINTYEPGHGTALATYTARCIENEILMLIRTNKKHKNNLSLSDPVGMDKDGNELEYTVVCLRYALKGGVPLPQREVAKMMKISRSYISRIEKRAIEKLRTRLHPEDFFE